MIWTRLAAAVLFVTFASSLPLVAGSYYPARLDDAKAPLFDARCFPGER